MGQAGGAPSASILNFRKPRIIRTLRLIGKQQDMSAAERALFGDIKMIFGQRKTDAMQAEALLSRLADPAPTFNGLKDTLAKFNVQLVPVKVGTLTALGYRLADLDRIWRRYNIVATKQVPVTTSPPTTMPVAVRTPTPRVKSDPGIDWLTWTAVFAAGCLSGVAAYFSVSGMTRIFPGAVLAVLWMASTMELTKFVGCAWLSRYWTSTSIFWRSVMVPLLIILAIINAVGVYGQLSAAHLDPSIEAATSTGANATEATARLVAQQQLVDDINRRIDLIDSTVKAAVDKGRASTALDLANSQRRERSQLVEQRAREQRILVDYKVEASKANGQQQKAAADAGVLEYAAAFLHIDREEMIHNLIMAMTMTCDPLAITLLALTMARRRMRLGALA